MLYLNILLSLVMIIIWIAFSADLFSIHTLNFKDYVYEDGLNILKHHSWPFIILFMVIWTITKMLMIYYF